MPADNDTRERLMNAAAQLLAKRSYSQVNVREITEAAGQSLGALNYHFGSKEGLLNALVRRAAPALIGEREQLLREAAIRSDPKDRLRGILRALLAPVIRWSRLPETQEAHLPMLNRLRMDCPPELRDLLEVDVRHLRPFVLALSQLFPRLSEAEIGWRLHFVLGIEHAIVSDAPRLEALVGNAAALNDHEAMTERVLDFVMPGWALLLDKPKRAV